MGYMDCISRNNIAICRAFETSGEITTEIILQIERFVMLLYKRTSPIKDVNGARAHLFSIGNHKIDNIPPTAAALTKSNLSMLCMGSVLCSYAKYS